MGQVSAVVAALSQLCNVLHLMVKLVTFGQKRTKWTLLAFLPKHGFSCPTNIEAKDV